MELAGCDAALKQRRESTALLRRLEAQPNRVALVQARLAEEAQALEATHAQLLGNLAPLVRAAYNVLVDAGRVPAIASVQRGVCSECRSSLPAALADETAGSGGILVCPACQRLLYRSWEGRRPGTE